MVKSRQVTRAASLPDPVTFGSSTDTSSISMSLGNGPVLVLEARSSDAPCSPCGVVQDSYQDRQGRLGERWLAAMHQFRSSWTSSPSPTSTQKQESIASDTDITMVVGLESCLLMTGIDQIRKEEVIAHRKVCLSWFSRVCVCVCATLCWCACSSLYSLVQC
jgi:hypothetical protein